jgi:hypothetical protein
MLVLGLVVIEVARVLLISPNFNHGRSFYNFLHVRIDNVDCRTVDDRFHSARPLHQRCQVVMYPYHAFQLYQYRNFRVILLWRSRLVLSLCGARSLMRFRWTGHS